MLNMIFLFIIFKLYTLAAQNNRNFLSQYDDLTSTSCNMMIDI